MHVRRLVTGTCWQEKRVRNVKTCPGSNRNVGIEGVDARV